MRRALLIGCLAATILPAGNASAADFVEGAAGLPQPLVTFASPAPATATIDWGDATAAEPAAVQAIPDGTGSVSGAHAYAKHGSYQVKVTAVGAPDVSQSTTANVTDAPITAQGVNGATAAAAGGLTLATITDGNTLGVPSSLQARIDWGDGVTTDGAVVSAGQPGRYLVQGSHAYPDGGSYLVTITIRSADGGTAEAAAEAQLEGVPDTAPAVTQGRVLDLGASALGARPSIAVNDRGTAYVAWTVRVGTDDSVAFCRVPRGARGCDLRKTLHTKVFASKTTILRGPSGRLYIVAAHVITGRGGTVVLTSGDDGQTWSSARYDVNVGIFQSAVSSAALSRDERAIYMTYGPFFNLSGAPLQGIGRLDLAAGGVAWIGDESFQRRVLSGAAVLPDGRGVVLANRHPDIKEGPLVATRVVGDASNATVNQPWTPVSGANGKKLATSPALASVLDCSPVRNDPFGTRIGAIPLRGLRAGPVRPLGFLTGDNSDCDDTDLTYDGAGGRHATYVGTADGCPTSRSVEPGRERGARICVVYRAAPPNGDFRPKTILAEVDPEAKVGGTAVGPPQGVRVGAGRDGRGWVVWRSFGDGHIRMVPTRDDTQAPATDTHPVVLTVQPNSECATTNSARVVASVGGPARNRPRIVSVAWTAGRGVVPRTETDRRTPFSLTAKVDPALYRPLSSTGVITVSSLVRASVRVRLSSGRVRTLRVQVPLSYYCSIKWSVAERRYAPARRPR